MDAARRAGITDDVAMPRSNHVHTISESEQSLQADPRFVTREQRPGTGVGASAEAQMLARARTAELERARIVEATRIAARVSKNVLLKDALEEIRTRVQAGRDIGDALATTGVFPPLVVLIFNVGQQTGKLEEMLDRLAEGYERQVASATARLTAAIEPILIVALAVFVGFILFATILPILEAGNVL